MMHLSNPVYLTQMIRIKTVIDIDTQVVAKDIPPPESAITLCSEDTKMPLSSTRQPATRLKAFLNNQALTPRGASMGTTQGRDKNTSTSTGTSTRTR
jgi:hypothetical protein